MYIQDIKNSALYRQIPRKYGAVSLDWMRALNDAPRIRPRQDLILFYAAQHVLGQIEKASGTRQLTPKAEELATQALWQSEQVFMRMFSYLVLISVGELRHAGWGGPWLPNSINEKIPSTGYEADDLYAMYKEHKGCSRSTIRSAFLGKDRCFRTTMDIMDAGFILGFPNSGSYGGPKWATIANYARGVLQGNLSPLVMVDVAWALVHNTGSIFNKSTIYSSKDSIDELTVLLDFQRAGAIVSMVLGVNVGEDVSSYKDYFAGWQGVAGELCNLAYELYGDEVAPVVNEQVLHSAGALSPNFSKPEPSTTSLLAGSNAVKTEKSMLGKKVTYIERVAG